MIYSNEYESRWMYPHTPTNIKVQTRTKNKTNKAVFYNNIKASTIGYFILGIMCLACSIGLFILTSQGTTVEDRDGTAILFFVPMSIGLLRMSIKSHANKNNKEE